jgi:N-acetylglucosamine-6-phosphate deacetylase
MEPGVGSMKGPHLILGARVLTPTGWVSPGAIVVGDGRLVFVGASDRVGVRPGRVTDLRPLTLMPGFIDIHIHGWGGVSIESGDHACTVALAMARNGTTSFLPTLTGKPDLPSLLDAVASTAAATGPTGGAEILGIHLEGPFLNPDPAVRGAQLPAHMRDPNVEELRNLHASSGGRLRYMTIAPELPGALDVIREANALGIVTGAGHSAASYEEALEAVAAGVRTSIHTFNGMKPLHHRSPGLLGAALTHPGFTAEVIADGVHVAPTAVDLLVRCKGPDRVILVTDSTQFAGLPDGRYEREGGRAVIKQGDRCYLEGSGSLSGSVVGMNRDVANIVRFVGVGLAEAVAMASANPSRLLGLGGRKGTLAVGYDADIIAIDDQTNVLWTMVGGTVVHASNDVRS